MSDHPIKVLLVEDNAGDVRLIEEMLAEVRGAPFDLECTDQLSTGLERLAAGGTDAILLDLSLPDSRGLDTFAKVHARAPQVPIIVLTGLDDEALAVEAVREGAQDYLVKGQVDSHLLARAMRYAIERKRAEEEVKRRNEELAALNAIATAVSQSLDLREVLDAALEKTLAVLNIEGGLIYLFDETSQTFAPAVHRGVSQNVLREVTGFKMGEGLSGRVAESGETLVVADLDADRRNISPASSREGWHSYAGVPLKFKGKVLGVMTLVTRQEGYFRPDHVGLLIHIGNQIGVAIENAWLYQNERKQAAQLALVSKVARQAASILDLDQLLLEVVTAIQRSFSYYHVGLFLLDEVAGELKMRAIAGGFVDLAPPGHRLALGEGMAGWTAKTGRSLLANDVSQESRYVLGILKEAMTKSELCVPLRLAGRVMGVLDIQSIQLNAFDETDLRAMETLADQIAMAIENAQLFGETKRRLEEMTALYQTSLDITARLEVPELLKSIVERAVALLQAESGGIYLYDPERGELRLAIGYDCTEEYIGVTLKPGEGMAGRVFQAGEPLIVDDYRTWEGRAPVYETDQPFTATLQIPLKWQERIIGVLAINADVQKRTFNQDDVWLATLFANQATVAIENARLYQETVRRLKEMEALGAVTTALTRSLNLDQVLQSIVDSATSLIPVSTGGVIHLADEATGTLIPRATSAPEVDIREKLEMSIGEGVAGLAMQEKRLINVSKVEEDPRFLTMDTATPKKSLLTAPLMMGDRCLGTISLHGNAAGAFTPDDERLLSTLASQAAIAVENARLYEKVTERMIEATLLHKVSNTLMRTLNLERLLENILEVVLQKAFGYSHCAILLPDRETGELSIKAARGCLQAAGEGLRIKIGREEITDWVAANKVPLNVPDVAKDGRYVEGGEGIRSELAVPMLAGEQLVGVLDVQSTEVNAFGEDDLRMLSSVAAQAAIAIERVRLFQEARRRSQEQATLFQASAAVLSTPHIDEVLYEVAKQMALAVDATSARVCQWNEAERTVTVIAEYISPHASQKGQVSDLGTVYTARDFHAFQILRDRQPLTVSLADPEISEEVRTHMAELGGNTVLYLPLAVRERVIGCVEVWESRRERHFTQEEISLCQTIGNQAAIAIENARLFAAEESSRQKMEAIIQNMTDGLLIIDTQGDIILANQRAVDLLGVTAGYMTDQNLLVLCPYPSLNALVKEALDRSPHTTSGEISIEETGRCDLGVAITPFVQDGEQVLWYVLLHDITRLKELDRMKSDFVSNVSHELRTPLANVKLYAALAQKGRPEKRHQYLAIIESETERLETLIEDILDLSRLERGAVKLQIEPLPLAEIVQQVVGAHLATARAKDVKLAWQVPDGLPPLPADRTQLLLMLNNLLGNALQYTPHGGSVWVEARVGERRGQPALHIAVRDTGIGIPADEYERIFERFYRGRHTPVGTTGTGLGLTIVKESMALHGGEVMVESAVGQGSTFTLCFPLETEVSYA